MLCNMVCMEHQEEPPEEAEWMTVQEVADVLRVHKMTVHRMINSRAIGSLKVGTKYLIAKEHLNEYMKRNWTGPLST